MMVICIKQHLSNIWSSINEKVYKKSVYIDCYRVRDYILKYLSKWEHVSLYFHDEKPKAKKHFLIEDGKDNLKKI